MCMEDEIIEWPHESFARLSHFNANVCKLFNLRLAIQRAACHFFHPNWLGVRSPCVLFFFSLSRIPNWVTEWIFFWFNVFFFFFLVSRPSRFSFKLKIRLSWHTINRACLYFGELKRWQTFVQWQCTEHSRKHNNAEGERERKIEPSRSENSSNPIYLVESVCLEIMTLLLLCEAAIFIRTASFWHHISHTKLICVFVCVSSVFGQFQNQNTIPVFFKTQCNQSVFTAAHFVRLYLA